MKSVLSKLRALAGVSAVFVLSACSVTPDFMDMPEITQNAKEDTALLAHAQQPIQGVLTLEEAMARAIKYNLENRMELMRAAMAQRNFEMVKMDMLPLLTLSANNSVRNNFDLSRSYNVTQGTETNDYTTSSEKRHFQADGRLVWNVLDFGASYLTAKQEGYRYIVGDLNRNNTILKVLEQVRSQFWRAATMQKISEKLDEVLADAEGALQRLKAIRKDALRPPRQVLEDIRALAEIVQQLEEMKQTAELSKIELAKLINEPFGTSFKLFVPDNLPHIPSLDLSINDLELLALSNSAEYISEMYNVKIDQLESRKALVRLLPGLEFSYNHNYDTNRYLKNRTWEEVGLRVSYDIFRLLAADEVMDHNEAREHLATNRRLMSNMATVAKLHLAWQQYQDAMKRYELSEFIGEIDDEISALTNVQRSSKTMSGLEQIRTEARTMRSLMARMLAYVEAQSNYGAFLTSLGINPVPSNYQQLALEDLSRGLKTYSIGIKGDKVAELVDKLDGI